MLKYSGDGTKIRSAINSKIQIAVTSFKMNEI